MMFSTSNPPMHVVSIISLLIFLRSASILDLVQSFSATKPFHQHYHQQHQHRPNARSSTSAVLLVGVASSIADDMITSTGEGDDDDEEDVYDTLTPELRKVATAFEMIGDDKLRYKQLLYMASQLETMDEDLFVLENKVPGCLSTVYVDGKTRTVQQGDNGDEDVVVIDFVGESDGLLTKGLVALLVRGLSGYTAKDIQRIDPRFIKRAGITASLTPGRNNGFLNMLSTMKRKALELEQQHYDQEGQQEIQPSDEPVTAVIGEEEVEMFDESRPMHSAIVQALQQLKPISMELTDVSDQHADGGDETHFDLNIVADAFDGLNLIQRHKLIYILLGDVMPKIEAISIQAKTPAEVEQ